MSKRCSLNVSHEGSLHVHIRAARHVSLWESITRVLCQVGNVSQRRYQICGGGSFLLCWLESKVSPCRVMLYHVVSCRVVSHHREGVEPHSDCNLDFKVREGSGKTLRSASGSFWLILKAISADLVQKQVRLEISTVRSLNSSVWVPFLSVPRWCFPVSFEIHLVWGPAFFGSTYWNLI